MPFTRQQILARLHQRIAAGIPIVGGARGMGLARSARRWGALTCW